MATRIQVRRDSAANWTSNNPTLADGEIGFETDTGLLKVGKSNTPWISLEYTQDSLPSYELYAKIQNFDPNTFPQDDDVTNQYDMEVGDVLVLDADTTNSAFALGDRVRANSVSEREYVFSNLSSALFNSASASIRTYVYNEETQQDDVTPGDTLILTTTNPNLAIKVGAYLTLYRNTDPIFGYISVEVKSISSNKLTYTCELTSIYRTSIDDVPQEFTATSWNALFAVGSYPGYHYPAFPQPEDAFDEGDSLAGVIPYAYLEGVITGLNANSASITIDNLGPSGAPYWFENMKISLAPGRDGLGYGYNVARNLADPSLVTGQQSYTNINFATIDIGSYVDFFDYLPGAYSVGDNVRVTFPNDYGAGILEGSITFADNNFNGYLQISVSKVVSRGDSLSIPQSGAKISLKGVDGAVGEVGPAGDNGMPGDNGLSAYEIWINEGNSGTEEDFFNSLQGPGYEVTWVDGTHSLPNDPQTNWIIGQTVWKAGDQYDIPGDFVNTAYKVGDYVKYLFNTGTYETDHWIEGWITAISNAGATIRVQRWGDTDWSSLGNMHPNTRTTYAHFEPGYNFDTYLSQNANATLNVPLSYNYLNNMIQNPAVNEYIELAGHLGSYKPGDYVIVSSRSNPLIKFTAYLVHAGLAGINGYASNFFPIEILSWDGDPDTGIEDFTLSPMPTPEVGYSFPYPYPNPTKATLNSPTFNGPMAYSALTTQTYPLSIDDIIQVRGVPGLYEVGDKVRAYDPYDKDAQFYGEISSIGSASNEWVSEITVKDPTVFTSSASTSNHNYKIALEERKFPFIPEVITPEFNSGNSYTYTVSKEDAGRTILVNSGVNVLIDTPSIEVPVGTQITIIQIADAQSIIGPAHFSETDTFTSGYVYLGWYSAATLVRTGFGWVVVGKFASAVDVLP